MECEVFVSKHSFEYSGTSCVVTEHHSASRDHTCVWKNGFLFLPTYLLQLQPPSPLTLDMTFNHIFNLGSSASPEHLLPPLLLPVLLTLNQYLQLSLSFQDTHRLRQQSLREE